MAEENYLKEQSLWLELYSQDLLVGNNDKNSHFIKFYFLISSFDNDYHPYT